MNKGEPTLRIFLLGIGIVCISTAAVLIRFTLAAGASSLIIAGGRLWVASGILGFYSLVRRRDELRNLVAKDLILMAGGGIALGVHFGAWVQSLTATSVASSVVLVTTSPLWVALGAACFLRERPTPRILLALLLGLSGMLVIGLADAVPASSTATHPVGEPVASGEVLAADGLALLGAMAAAVYFVIGRSVRTRVSTAMYGAIVYGSAALCLTVVAWFLDRPAAALTAPAWAGIVLLGLVPQLAGHTILNWALARSPATLVSLAVLGEPLGAILLAYILLGEAPAAGQMAGGVILLAGLFLASRDATVRA